MAEETTQGTGWHRVCLNTIVRATKELDSARLRILPMGSRVNVVEVVGRRVKIDQPIDGWCSIESSNGDLILSKAHDDQTAQSNNEEGKDTFTTNDKNFYKDKADQVASELKELQNLREQLEVVKQKTNETQENEELKKKLLQQAQEYEKLQNEIEQKKSQLDQLASTAEASQKQQHVVAQKLYKLLGTEDASKQIPSSNTSGATNLLCGDVVMLPTDRGMGIVRFVGKVHFSEEIQVGVQLGEPIQEPGRKTHNGTWEDVQYFECEAWQGEFYNIGDIPKKIAAENLLRKLHLIVAKLTRTGTAVEGKD